MAASKTNSSADDTSKGLSEKPVRKTVGDYPERPYGEAITAEHRAFLEEQGVHVTKKTATEQDAVLDTP